MKIEFIELKNGSLEEIIFQLPESGKAYGIIRDDDAAEVGAPAFYYTECTDIEAIKKAYEDDGGTASWVVIATKSAFKTVKD